MHKLVGLFSGRPAKIVSTVVLSTAIVSTASIRHAWGFGEAVAGGGWRGGLRMKYFYQQNYIFEADN